jgi:AraC-like DNA-binding protein
MPTVRKKKNEVPSACGPLRHGALPVELHPMKFVTISTDDFPESSRLADWREVYARNLAHADIEPLDDRPFRASAKFLTLPDLSVTIDSRSDSRYIFGKEAIARMADHVALAIVARGAGHVAQLGREVSSDVGAAVLVSGADPLTATLRGDGTCTVLTFPRAALQRFVPDIDAALVRPIPRDVEALRLLTNYMGVLRDGDNSLSPDLALVYAGHLRDLAALTLGARGEARELALARGAKAARRKAILDAIDASAHAPNASVAAIARKLGISDRYIRAILQETGKTFSELVLERRLALVWARFNDSQFNGQSISEIAFSAGFSDISYFNRSFRRHFGETPTGVRGSGRSG